MQILESLSEWYWNHRTQLGEINAFELHMFEWRGLFPVLAEYADANPIKLKWWIRLHNIIRKWNKVITPYRHKLHDFENRLFSGPVKIQLPTLDCRESGDYGEIMFHVNFQILVDFIEIEMAGDAHDAALALGYNPRKLKFGKRYPDIGIENCERLSSVLRDDIYVEAIFLYKWWKQVAVPRHAHVKDNYMFPFKDFFRKEVVNFNKFRVTEQTEMLQRLIRLSPKLFG